jgi:hypothetical protein
VHCVVFAFQIRIQLEENVASWATAEKWRTTRGRRTWTWRWRRGRSPPLQKRSGTDQTNCWRLDEKRFYRLKKTQYTVFLY